MQPNIQFKANAKCSYLADDFATQGLIYLYLTGSSPYREEGVGGSKAKKQTPHNFRESNFWQWLRVMCRAKFQTIASSFQTTLFCSETNSHVNEESSHWNSTSLYQETAARCYS